MPKFEKKNPVVEALQWTGANKKEIDLLVLGANCHTSVYMQMLFLHEPSEVRVVESRTQRSQLSNSIDGGRTWQVPHNSWIIVTDDGKVEVHDDQDFRARFKEL